jgi:sulfur relay (sulfurtransferase) DsrC/TusE family protein
MRILIFTCFALLNICNTNNFHESISATFNVIKRGHVLMLEIDFDEENFIKFGESKSLHVSKEDFSNYLHKTTSWEFDGKKLIPQVLEIKSVKHHTKVICYLSKYRENIKSVTIKNEFLLNVKSHSNIVKLDINNTFKDYRLHKERREIKVDYN